MRVVFDLDDTLADCHHRVKKYIICPERGRPHRQDPIDWRAFFDECHLDAPIEYTFHIFNSLVGLGHEVRIWTGRDSAVRELTIDWLGSHVPRVWLYDLARNPDLLVMRDIGDRTDDHILKPSWVDKYDFRPDLVFEDRSRVVQAWRELGIPCFQVAPGDF